MGRSNRNESDNAPARFLTYLVAALQTIKARQGTVGNIGEGPLAALQSPQQPPPESALTRSSKSTAIPRTGRMPLRLYVLVLDDYHAIDAPRIHGAVTFLLDHLPPQLHLVIASRADPPFPLARLRAQGKPTELRIDDLRFTPGETAAFLNESLSSVVWRSIACQFATGATRRDARVASAGGSLVRAQLTAILSAASVNRFLCHGAL